MTMVLEAARPRPAIPQTDDHADAADALEEMIAAHRLALLALAPHQEERAARIETGWHMEHLGVLLGQRAAQTHRAAPGGVPGRERRESNGTDRQTR